jgi:hypothetical protein
MMHATKRIIAIGLALFLLLGVVTYAMGPYATGRTNDREALVSTLKVGIPQIPSHLVINSSLSQSAIDRAEYLILQGQSAKPEEGEIVLGSLSGAAEMVEASKSEENSWKAVIYAREASIEAMTVVAYGQAKEGKLSEKDVLGQIPGWTNEIQLLKTKLSYKGENLQDALISRARVERSLDSAESWLKQVPETLSFSDMPREFRIAQAMGDLEAARGNLGDAEFLLDSVQKDGSDQEGTITDAYEKFYGETTPEVDSRDYPKESFANLTLYETKGFIERAESGFNNGYKASATMDIMYAFVSLQILDTLSDVPDPWYSDAPITAKDVYEDKEQAVKALNEAMESAEGDQVALYLLKSARSEIALADHMVKRSVDHGRFENNEALRIAHAYYFRASIYARNVNKVSELLES